MVLPLIFFGQDNFEKYFIYLKTIKILYAASEKKINWVGGSSSFMAKWVQPRKVGRLS